MFGIEIECSTSHVAAFLAAWNLNLDKWSATKFCVSGICFALENTLNFIAVITKRLTMAYYCIFFLLVSLFIVSTTDLLSEKNNILWFHNLKTQFSRAKTTGKRSLPSNRSCWYFHLYANHCDPSTTAYPNFPDASQYIFSVKDYIQLSCKKTYFRLKFSNKNVIRLLYLIYLLYLELNRLGLRYNVHGM